jgi:hypothetical protein
MNGIVVGLESATQRIEEPVPNLLFLRIVLLINGHRGALKGSIRSQRLHYISI